MPSSSFQLKQVHGVGKKTWARIGEELLAIVTACSPRPEGETAQSASATVRREAGDTKQVSFNLYGELRMIVQQLLYTGAIEG